MINIWRIKIKRYHSLRRGGNFKISLAAFIPIIPRNRTISYTKTRAKIKETITHSVSGRKMNFTTVNSILMTCGISFLPINPENISSDLPAVFIARIAVNALTCLLIIMLNILVMVAENQTTASHQI